MIEHNDHAGVKIPPPLLVLIHILAAFLLNWLLPLHLISMKYFQWVGYSLCILGLGAAFSAISQFRKMNTTVNPHGSVSVIVVSGPYRFSRNPIYLGFVLVLIGLPLALNNYWGVVLSPLLVVFMTRLVIQHEETYLEGKFGDEYKRYKSRVRRWL